MRTFAVVLSTVTLGIAGCGGGGDDDGFDAPAGQGPQSGAPAGVEKETPSPATPDGETENPGY